MTIAASRYFHLVIALLVSLDLAKAASSELDEGARFERCRTISDSAARLRCHENIASGQHQSTPPSPQLIGTWRLVRTSNPRGGPDAVSMMHTADISKSDPDLAGLMLRCGSPVVEIVIVLIEPMPPQARPQVRFGSGVQSQEFMASVIPPGAALLLPRGAETLITGPWQSLSELSVEVKYEDKPIRGVVPLSGLHSALEILLANCPSQ